MEFMKTEGDRSGVDIPDRKKKAHNLVVSSVTKLYELAYADWQDLNNTAVYFHINNVIETLERAKDQLEA